MATNTWLGFPFMMVVTLGALSGHPARPRRRGQVERRHRLAALPAIVTLPLVKPALVPAIILGSIWTFNMDFNVVYLVSGGEPTGPPKS